MLSSVQKLLGLLYAKHSILNLSSDFHYFIVNWETFENGGFSKSLQVRKKSYRMFFSTR